MDLWDEDDDFTRQTKHSDREWTRIQDSFINDGYREGITAGKEGALQEGFDDGFAAVGVPLGRRIGTLRGIASGLTAFAQGRAGTSTSHVPPDTSILAEIQFISQSLSKIQLSDIAPADLEAEEHERQHSQAGEEPRSDDANTDDTDDLSAAFSSLGTSDTAQRRAQRRAEALAELESLEQRLAAVLRHLNIQIQLPSE